MRYYPLFIDTRAKAIALVGDGIEAVNKYRLIKRTDARIDVFSDNPNNDLLTLLVEDGIQSRPLNTFNLDEGYLAVFIATQSRAVEEGIYQLCIANNVPVNVVDKKEKCTFITPAIVDRSPLIIAIGTEGSAPVLARHIKSNLESQLPKETGSLLKFLASKRTMLARTLKTHRQRRRFWQQIMPISNPTWLATKAKSDWLSVVKNAVSDVLNKKPESNVVQLPLKPPHHYNVVERSALQNADVIINIGDIDHFTNDLARRDALFFKSSSLDAVRQANTLHAKGLSVVLIDSELSPYLSHNEYQLPEIATC